MPESITVGEVDGGAPYTIPVEELLTGRAFITGKSGAGKSNSVSVVVEELLDRGHPMLIVDIEGEYWGLKETYEVLHVGATEECDLQVGPEHAGKLAQLALEQRVPIILDVSGYVDADEADELVREVARELFAREQQVMHPFLLIVEEIHEYIPQRGSPGETGEMLIRVAKRGRKRGLGLCGLSQRPASVDKEFITQADLLVWHRLTWENDTDVVKRVVGDDYADLVTELGDGEAFVQADWSETDVERVQFRRKETFDAGATPGLDDVERPELKSIDDDLVGELAEISDRHQRKQDRVAELERHVEKREARISELEEELEDARDLQRLGEAFVDAARSSGEAGVEVEQHELLEEKNETITGLRSDLEALQDELKHVQEERDELADEIGRLQSIEDRVAQAERIEEQLERARSVLGVEVEERVAAVENGDEELIRLRDRIDELEAENERLRRKKESNESTDDLAAMVAHESVQAAVDTAKKKTKQVADRHIDRVLSVLANAEEGTPLTAAEISPLTEVGDQQVRRAGDALYNAGVVTSTSKDGSKAWALDREFLETRIEVAEQQSRVQP